MSTAPAPAPRRRVRRFVVTSGAVLVAGVVVAGGVAAWSWSPWSTSDESEPSVDVATDRSPATGSRVGAVTEAVTSERLTVADAVGESSFAWADIVAATTTMSSTGVVTTSIEVDQWTDPASDDWRFGATGPAWSFDLDGDGTADAEVRADAEAGPLGAHVTDAAGTVVCLADAGSNPGAGTYTATFDVACLGNPDSVRFRARFDYEDVAFDLVASDQLASWSAPLTNPASGPSLVTLQPDRLYDSRDGAGRRPAGSTTEIVVTDRSGVPDDALGVILNVTAVNPSGKGFITVHPCGDERPDASNLNFTAGVNIPNAVIAKVGINGKVCFFTDTETHLLVDVNGYIPRLSDVTSLQPDRLYDSRDGAGRRPAGSTTEIVVTDRSGVPDDALGVILNVTAVNPSGKGFITVHPCGDERPDASNLNFTAGVNIPNAVIAKVGINGKVCFFTDTETHLLVDVNGYIP